MNTSAELKNVTGSKSESTEIGLFVRTSGHELAKWDKQAIYDALIRETDISPDAATVVAREVEKMVAKIKEIAAHLDEQEGKKAEGGAKE